MEGLGAIDYGDRGIVRVVADPPALAQAAAQIFAHVANTADGGRGRVCVALSGGSTPQQMGELLAQPPYREEVEWDRLEIFWGDERWAPLDSPESNAGVAKRTFLDTVAIPPTQVHPFETVGITAEESAARYAALLRTVVGLKSESGLPRFGLVFLGMGDDGHTASLFPGTAAIHEREALAVAHYVPKLDATRLTLTPPVLNAARQVVFLVSGAGKAETLAAVLNGPVRPDELPSQVVRPTDGIFLWLVDDAAASRLVPPAGLFDG